jgi:hypothetical protein
MITNKTSTRSEKLEKKLPQLKMDCRYFRLKEILFLREEDF